MKTDKGESERVNASKPELGNEHSEAASIGTGLVQTGVAAASFFGFIAISAVAVGSAMLAEAGPAAFVAIIVIGMALEAFLAYAYARRAGVRDRRFVIGIAVAPIVVASILTAVLALYWFR